MTTGNSINANTAGIVGYNGSGTFTGTPATNHAVLVGGATSSTITNLVVGTTGQLLVGASAADPAFASSANGDFTFTTSTAGATRTLAISNTDNSNVASNALSQITTGGSSAGDAFQTFTITGATNWSHGIDNSSLDQYKISASSSLGTTDVIVATTGGAVTKPLQPAFNYYNSSSRGNVTGDGTSYTLIFNAAASTQQGSGFDGTSTFTAPVTGWYHFDLGVTLTGIAAQTQAYITITHTAIQTYYGPSQLASATASGGALALNMSRTFKMTSGDTVTCTAVVAGSTKTVGVDGSAVNTGFQGYLVC